MKKMKRIVNGKIYDTEKADEIAHWDNGYYPNDFRFEEGWLYQTKKGNFFVVEGGGPMSRFAKHYGNTTTGSTVLRPVSENEAKDILEREDPETAIEIFGNQLEEA